MSDQIQLDQWYEQNGLHYRFDDLHRGTNAVVRGDVDKLTHFVHQLDLAYHKGGFYQAGEIETILQEVLEIGKAQTREVICFSDDRIRLIRRMDDDSYGRHQDSPLSGSQSHVELTHNEQYGGKWPVRNNPPNAFVDGSRADMIYKVLTALGNMKE
jgi:hypothetical protein